MIFKVFNSIRGGRGHEEAGGSVTDISGKHSNCHGHNQRLGSDEQNENIYLGFVSSHTDIVLKMNRTLVEHESSLGN